MKLTKPACYHDKAHVLALDNWYTSIDVIKHCTEDPLYMDVIGTVKTIRTGLHKESLFSATCRNNKARGTIEVWKRPINEEEEVSLYQTSWMDSNPVHLLSTFSSGFTMVGRNKFCQCEW